MLKLLIMILALISSIAPLSATPLSEETVLSMVPRGKLDLKAGRDYTIKTPAGTKVMIEIKRNGLFEEARGANLNKGDNLEPGFGLLSLSSVAQILNSKGHKAEGGWWLEQDESLGWVYEFEGSVVVNARNGKIISK